MTKLEKRQPLNEKIFVKLGNKPKLIKLMTQARKLEQHQEKIKKQWIKLSAPELEDYFWDCVYSIYPVEQDLEELFTSKRIDWK